MKKGLIKSIMHDLRNMMDWMNPLEHFSVVENMTVDLVNQKIDYPDKDSVYDFYEEKMKWFNGRIDKLDGWKDVESAKIFVSSGKEKIEIVFKGKKYVDERLFEKPEIPFIPIGKIKEAIRNLKSSADVSKMNKGKG